MLVAEPFGQLPQKPPVAVGRRTVEAEVGGGQELAPGVLLDPSPMQLRQPLGFLLVLFAQRLVFARYRENGHRALPLRLPEGRSMDLREAAVQADEVILRDERQRSAFHDLVKELGRKTELLARLVGPGLFVGAARGAIAAPGARIVSKEFFRRLNRRHRRPRARDCGGEGEGRGRDSHRHRTLADAVAFQRDWRIRSSGV